MTDKQRKRSENYEIINPNEDNSQKKSVHHINSLFFIIGLLYILFVVNLSKKIMNNTENLTTSDLPFVGIEAWKDLKVLNDMGPKVTGSKENEVTATNYIKKRIETIISKAHTSQTVLFDHQIVSGSYFLDFNPGMIASYRSVQNLVARIEGEVTKNAVLLNCHYDSVMGSPGANDDIANCAVMLELLSILSSRNVKTRHTIIFLFNGAEEVGLRASHGFITKHKWAKDVKVVINLEAAGSGGKEILFQSGPGNSWLLNHYHAVRRPFAQAASEEIFQSGIIPSDTDFRIFRDFGNVIGLDFAHFVKGYRYHTKYDSIDFLTPGNVQRTGENILELSLSLANGYELDNIENFRNVNDLAVYFDYLGFIFVHYTKEVGFIINFTITILSIVTSFITLTRATGNCHTKHVLTETLLGFLSIVVGAGVAILASYVTGFALDKTGHALCWYQNTFLAPGIYSSISILMLILSYDVISLTLENKYSPLSLGLKVQAKLNGINVMWGIVCLGFSLIGIRSAYLMMIILLFNFIITMITFLLKKHNSVHTWVYIFLFGQFFILLWTSYLYNAVIQMFIPIMGRAGSGKNPEAFISVLSSVTTLFIVSYFIPLTQLLKSKSLKYLSIIAIFSVSVFLATSTDYGFPYQDEKYGNPTPQRHHVLHTQRTFYDENGSTRYSDSGILFIEWDRNSPKTIEGLTMPYEPKTLTEMCNNEPLCGLPIVQSRMIKLGMSWLPASSPKVLDNAIIDSHNKIVLDNNSVKFEFSINSTALSGLYIHPREHAELFSWSFSDEFEDLMNKTYFVSVANGLESEIKPYKFDITLKVPTNIKNPLIDITLVTTHYNREEDYTTEFKNLLIRFPKWTFPVSVLAAVNSYIF